MRTGPEKMRSRRTPELAVEWLEGRDLPTAPALLAGPVSSADLGPVSARPGPTAAAVPQVPTPHELAREQFVAKFSGSFVTGPGRFTDQASQTFIKGGGTSSAFLHGDIQMAVYSPVDPNGQTTGTAALIVKNVSNSGNLLVLDLQGDTTSLDRAGRPTRFTWTVDGSSGGTFSGATGQGTVEIRYWSGGKLPARARMAGSAGVIFRGRIDTNGITNVLRS
jgi:hypothetical protein